MTRRSLLFVFVIVVATITSIFGASNVAQNQLLKSVYTDGVAKQQDFYEYQNDIVPNKDNSFNTPLASLGLGTLDSFVLLSSEKDDIYYTHNRYQQIHNGYSIMDAICITHANDARLISINGKFARSFISNGVDISEAEALKSAMSRIGNIKYAWLDSSYVYKHWNFHHDSSHIALPKGSLVYAPSIVGGRDYILCWKFRIYDVIDKDNQDIYIDASNGGILHQNPITHACALGTGLTTWYGTWTLYNKFISPNYILHDDCSGHGGQVHTIKHSDYTDYTDGDNNWSVNLGAITSHWGTVKAVDYLNTVHSRRSYDNVGGTVTVYNNAIGENNAYASGTTITYGGGSSSTSYYDDWNELVIQCHEFFHIVTAYTAGLIYSNESGALNEAFSDIFGSEGEYYTVGSTNWILGDERGSAFRNMSNPNAHSHPDTKDGLYWYTGTADYGGVHTNSGVLNFMYYLLRNGGSGINDNGYSYNVSGIGYNASRAIAYRALVYYLTPSSVYGDARTAFLNATRDLYGISSTQYTAVVEAWCAVGMGTCSIAPSTYTVSLSSSPSAGGYTTGAGTYTSSTSVSINAYAYSGYTFTGWYESGTMLSSSPSYTFVISSNRTIEARYTISTPSTYTVSLSNSPSAGGYTTGAGTYTSSTSVSINAYAYSGYTFTGWYESGTMLSSSPSYTFVISSNRTIEARYTVSAPSTYTVTLSNSPSSGGFSTGAGSYSSGTSISISAFAYSGYTFDGWYESGSLISTSANYIFSITSNRSIEARYTLIPPTTFDVIVFSAPTAGGMSTGSGTYPIGSSVTINATPSSSYRFDGFYESGTLLSTSTSYILNIYANRVIDARYSLIPPRTYSISCITTPIGGGILNGYGTYNAGDICTLIASPASGFTLDGIYKSGVLVSTSTTYSFTVLADATYEARFIPSTSTYYTLTLKKNSTGCSTSSSVWGTGRYLAGSSVRLNAISSTDCSFLYWQDSATSIIESSDPHYSFIITGDKTFDAIFVGNSTSIDDMKAADALDIFPNPFIDNIYLKFNSLLLDKYMSITLSNNLGQTLQAISNEEMLQNLSIDMSSYSSGIYYIELLLSNGKHYTYKIIKQ